MHVDALVVRPDVTLITATPSSDDGNFFFPLTRPRRARTHECERLVAILTVFTCRCQEQEQQEHEAGLPTTHHRSLRQLVQVSTGRTLREPFGLPPTR